MSRYLYIYALIYALPAFLDCHALDATRWRFKLLHNDVLEYSNYKEKNLEVISDSYKTNVTDNKLLKPYIIHRKGYKGFNTR